MTDHDRANELLLARLEGYQAGFDKGVDLEREACAQLCSDFEDDQWRLYKGRAPYTGDEEGRASEFVQGVSDGAGQCAQAIRARGDHA